jgi:hypothetical protein
MVKLKLQKPEMVTLAKGNKKITRPYTDYKANQRMWEIRGFKVHQDNVKEDKVVELKPKRKTRKKKNERMDLETD